MPPDIIGMWARSIHNSHSRDYRQIPGGAPETKPPLQGIALSQLNPAGNAVRHFMEACDSASDLPALWSATCEANDPALARALLEAGADPNDGESIYHAAEKNHRECLEVFLEFGSNLSARHPRWNNTPLYFILGHKPGSAM